MAGGLNVALDKVVERFIEGSPVTVMARLGLERALEPQWLDALFEQHSERQYTGAIGSATEHQAAC